MIPQRMSMWRVRRAVMARERREARILSKGLGCI